MNLSTLSFVAVICGLLGSAVLAFSVGRIIRMLVNAVKAHEETLKGMNDSKRDVPVFTGFGKQLDRAKKYDGKVVLAGLLLVVASFALELAVHLLPPANGG